MERLTEYMGNGENYESINPIDTPYEYGKANLQALINKLAAYEDAEEQGLLLRLLCGIGTDIYYIPSEKNFRLNLLDGHGEENRVFHKTVDRITFRKNGWYMEYYPDLEYGTGRILLDTSYGVTWFLTSEEAEAKLKEMEGRANGNC